MSNSIKFKVGKVSGIVHGGRYLAKPIDFPQGVCMAKELKVPAFIRVPIIDFGIPTEQEMLAGIVATILLLRQEGKVYVGCAGGIGRTGLMLSSLRKVQLTANYEASLTDKKAKPIQRFRNFIKWCTWVRLDTKSQLSVKFGTQAIMEVRSEYNHHAVETGAQMQFIRNLDVKPVITLLRELNLL